MTWPVERGDDIVDCRVARRAHGFQAPSQLVVTRGIDADRAMILLGEESPQDGAGFRLPERQEIRRDFLAPQGDLGVRRVSELLSRQRARWELQRKPGCSEARRSAKENMGFWFSGFFLLDGVGIRCVVSICQFKTDQFVDRKVRTVTGPERRARSPAHRELSADLHSPESSARFF